MRPRTQEFVAEVSERGRVTIPRELRPDLVDDADAVRFVRTDDGEVLLRPVDSATDLRGILSDTTDEEGRSALEPLRMSPSAESSPSIKK